MKFQWSLNTNTCQVFVGDSCYFPDEADGKHVIASKTIAKKGSWEITPDMFAQWKGDADGYLYIRFKTGKVGEMTISTDAPEETDPVYPHATIQVACAEETGRNLTVSVSEAQHITISDSGGVVEEWDAAPGETKAISLESGTYMLQGENEQLNILMP